MSLPHNLQKATFTSFTDNTHGCKKKNKLKNNHEQNIHLFPSCFFDKVKLRTKRDLLFGTGQKRKQISISNIL